MPSGWTSSYLLSKVFCGIQREISQELLMNLISKTCSTITSLKLPLRLPSVKSSTVINQHGGVSFRSKNKQNRPLYHKHVKYVIFNVSCSLWHVNVSGYDIHRPFYPDLSVSGNILNGQRSEIQQKHYRRPSWAPIYPSSVIFITEISCVTKLQNPYTCSHARASVFVYV